MISRELIFVPDRGYFIVEGNPTDGYSVDHVTHQKPLGHFRRKWQAIQVANSGALGPDGSAA